MAFSYTACWEPVLPRCPCPAPCRELLPQGKPTPAASWQRGNGHDGRWSWRLCLSPNRFSSTGAGKFFRESDKEDKCLTQNKCRRSDITPDEWFSASVFGYKGRSISSFLWFSWALTAAQFSAFAEDTFHGKFLELTRKIISPLWQNPFGKSRRLVVVCLS